MVENADTNEKVSSSFPNQFLIDLSEIGQEFSVVRFEILKNNESTHPISSSEIYITDQSSGNMVKHVYSYVDNEV